MKVYTDIKMVPVDNILPYWNNPRTNTKTREALVDAFKKIGFNQPIVIDKKGVIVKGHARYYAAKIAGMTEIPCLISEKGDKENQEDRILDNKIQDLTTWEKNTLEAELRNIDIQIQNLNFDVDEAIKEMISEGGSLVDEAIGEPKVYMVCPECGHEFELTQSEILAMEDWNGEES